MLLYKFWIIHIQFSSVQSLSHVRLFATSWIAARQASLSITNSRSSPKPTSVESVMPSSHLILCRPLFLLRPIPPSISLFQWINSSHEVGKIYILILIGLFRLLRLFYGDKFVGDIFAYYLTNGMAFISFACPLHLL